MIWFLRKLRNFYHECENLKREDARLQQSIALLRSGAMAQKFGSGFGDDERSELETFFNYKNQVTAGVENVASESGATYREVERAVSAILHESIPACLNFGVNYAYVDSKLATRHPETHFVGIDRSELTREQNRHCFGHIPNLEFLAGDILDTIHGRSWKDGLLLSARTLVLLPQSFVTALYQAASQAGFRYVVAGEQVGIRRDIQQPYRFSEHPQPSAPFRNGMFIHNYPYLMKQAGYQPQEARLASTPHPRPDFRLLSITGKLN